tara:strand:+ start:1501 stop:2115 length:615 start_codon:yes stop_codon:yes gene_type:complete
MDILFSLLGVAIFNVILLFLENDKLEKKKRKKKFLKLFNSKKTNALEAITFLKEKSALYKSDSSTKESITESLGEHIAFTKLCKTMSQVLASSMVAFFLISACNFSLSYELLTLFFYVFSSVFYIIVFLISLFFYKVSLELYEHSKLIMSNIEMDIDSDNELLSEIKRRNSKTSLSLNKEFKVIDILCMLSPAIKVNDNKENTL